MIIIVADIPMEIPERPNTRRSRLRSRSGEPHQAETELGPGHGVIAPALDLGEMDAIPPNLETSPQMPVRRSVPHVSASTSGAAAPKAHPAVDGSAAAVDPASAAMSLLVISQRKNLTSKEGAAAAFNDTHESPRLAVGQAPNGVLLAPVVPEAPRSAAPSGAPNAGGRRGRNITGPAGASSGAVGEADGAQQPSRLVPVAPPGGKPSAIRPS
jgi:hypothetical protein